MKIKGDIRVTRKEKVISRGAQGCDHGGMLVMRCFESLDTFVQRTVCYGCSMKRIVRTTFVLVEGDISSK